MQLKNLKEFLTWIYFLLYCKTKLDSTLHSLYLLNFCNVFKFYFLRLKNMLIFDLHESECFKIPHIDGGYINLYMWWNCLEPHTYTSAYKNWWNLNKVCRLYHCQCPSLDIILELCKYYHWSKQEGRVHRVFLCDLLFLFAISCESLFQNKKV